VQLAVRAFERGWFGVRLVGGTGVLAIVADARPVPDGPPWTSALGMVGEVHAGVAVTAELSRDWWFRLQFAELMTTARDAGYAYCPELRLGLVTRIGRRDRW
jgi:hypothetical protein